MAPEHRQPLTTGRRKRWHALVLAVGIVVGVLSAQATAGPPASEFVAAERLCQTEGGVFLLDNEFAGGGYVCAWGRNAGGPRHLRVAENLCRKVHGGTDFWLTEFLSISYSCYVPPA